MTGFGEARDHQEQPHVAVEVRSVNNRHFKLSLRTPDRYAALESEIEKLVRESIARGTVTLSIRLEGIAGSEAYRLNESALEAYWTQAAQLADRLSVARPNDLAVFLTLPGVLAEPELTATDAAAEWPRLQRVISEALSKLQAFRAQEGAAMAADLRQNVRIIADELTRIAAVAPQVVVEYRDRLHQRLQELLREADVRIDPSDLIREVSLFADKVDINEEITRLRSHLQQFDAFITEKTSQGRKLEFLCQEMFREVNTIGSKANNVSIAHCAVNMKTAIERLREVLANVE